MRWAKAHRHERESEVIHVGIIGCGGVAVAHADAIAAFPSRATLVAAADLRPPRLELFAERYGVRTYGSAEELLAQPDLDCVLIALPNEWHAPVAIQAAEAGKHILLEKPMAITLEECDEVLEAVAQSGVTLSVGQSYRYLDGPWHAKQVLDRGEVGDLVFAIGIFSKNWGIEGRRDWHLDRRRGGGMWMANGVHVVNTLQWLADSPVIAVKGMSGQYFHPYSQMDAHDGTLALLQHRNGTYTVAVAVGYRRGARKDLLEITCTAGMICCDKGRLWIGVDEEWRERPVESASDKVREWDEFLTSLEEEKAPPISGREARDTLRVLLAVEESAATGREVRLDDESGSPEPRTDD